MQYSRKQSHAFLVRTQGSAHEGAQEAGWSANVNCMLGIESTDCHELFVCLSPHSPAQDISRPWLCTAVLPVLDLDPPAQEHNTVSVIFIIAASAGVWGRTRACERHYRNLSQLILHAEELANEGHHRGSDDLSCPPSTSPWPLRQPTTNRSRWFEASKRASEQKRETA